MAVKKEKGEPVIKDVSENTEQRFQLNVLQRDCLKLYGVTSSTFAGAVFNIPEGEYTVEEIGSRIKAWLGKEAG